MRWDMLLLVVCLLDVVAGPAHGRPELAVMMGLGEVEWRVMRERIFPPFEQQHNVAIRGIQVEAPDAVKKLTAMHRARRMEVDLITQDVLWLTPLVEAGVVEDLSSYRDGLTEAAIPQLVQVGEIKGRQYFMPYRPNVKIAYYNEVKFDAYGLRPPQTWEELLAVAQRFHQAEGIGRVVLQGTLESSTTTEAIEFIWAAGGDPLVLNDAGSVQAFTFLQQLAPYLAPETRRANWNTTNTFLAMDAVHLARNWPFGVQLLVQEAGKTEIKVYRGWRGPVREAHVLGGEVIGLPQGAPQRELALELMRYLMSKPVQETLVAHLGWPSYRTDAYHTVHTWQAPYFAAVQEALAHVLPRPQVSYWAQVDRAVTGAFRDIVYDGQPVQATLERYHRQLQQARQRGR